MDSLDLDKSSPTTAWILDRLLALSSEKTIKSPIELVDNKAFGQQNLCLYIDMRLGLQSLDSTLKAPIVKTGK